VIRGCRVGVRPARPVMSLGDLLGLGPSEEWAQFGLCAQTDPEAYFPEKGMSTGAAKQVCQVCPVRSECLEYALDHNERFGVWGGLSERERRPLVRARRVTADAGVESDRRVA
jgi:WhiB family redox-sensing transcriptional regulator